MLVIGEFVDEIGVLLEWWCVEYIDCWDVEVEWIVYWVGWIVVVVGSGVGYYGYVMIDKRYVVVYWKFGGDIGFVD